MGEIYKDINSELGTEYENDYDINWREVSKYKLNKNFILKYYEYIDLEITIVSQGISIEDLDEVLDKYPENLLNDKFVITLLQFKILTEGFILKHYKELTRNRKLSDNLISCQNINNILDELKPKLTKYYTEEELLEKLRKESLFFRNPPKTRDWFIGYTKIVVEGDNDFYVTDNKKLALLVFSGGVSKVRVYWKDLKWPFVFSKVEIIKYITKDSNLYKR